MSDAWAPWRVAALLLVGVVIAYSAVPGYGYVYEDYRALQAGPVGALALAPRGLSTWLWRIADPRAAHLLSLALHLLAGCLTGLLGRRLGLSGQAAILAGGLLLLHPLAVESVAYVSSRAELLAAIGILLACLCATGPWWVWPLIVPAMALALAGKESGIVGLGLVPLVWAYRWPRWWTWALVAVGALAWLPLGLWRLGGDLTWLIHYDDATASLGWQWWVLAQSTAVFRLAVLSVVSWLPVGHTIDFDYDAISRLSRVAALVLVGLIPLVLWLHRARVPRLVLYACAACIVALIPRMVIQTPRAYLSEHQFYVPLIFVAIAAGACWQAWPPSTYYRWNSERRVRTWVWLNRRELVAVILLLCLTWQTRTAVQVWASDLTLWRNASVLAPTKPRPAANYAVALLVGGNREAGEAMLDYAARIADDPHVTPWDRREALEMVAINRLELRDIDARAYLRQEAELVAQRTP